MSNWPGNLIRKTPVTPAGPFQNGAASGVWSLAEAAYWTKQGLWPIAGNALVRGLFGGGSTGSTVNTIDFINITSTGNATTFGQLTVTRYGVSGFSSSTRGVFGGGLNPSPLTTIDYVTIASTGNAITFGSLIAARYGLGSCSNETRGLFAGGQDASYAASSSISYVTIATTGNSISFGNLTGVSADWSCGFASTTRGVFTRLTRMDYVTIATTGNAVNFGFLINFVQEGAGCSSSTRGLICGGNGPINSIEYVTIATTGNSLDFGDLTVARSLLAATSSSTRGVIGGGTTTGGSSGSSNTIDYVTIATTGNAVDFGDITQARYGLAACSNVHGGLA